MVMREETRKSLERALMRERLRKAGIGLGVLALIGLYMAYQYYDNLIDNVPVTGTITELDPLVSKNNAGGDGQKALVRLDSGHLVSIIVLKSNDPKVGDHISLVEHRHASGRVNHSLK